jgi:hypothetical protein
VAELEQTYQKSPEATVQKGLPKMEKANDNFKLTFMILGVPAAVGLDAHYLGSPSWGRGLWGAALILISAIGLLVDWFAKHRAHPLYCGPGRDRWKTC